MIIMTIRAIATLLLLLVAVTAMAAQDIDAGPTAQRKAIIDLFENTLSGAYTFSRPGQLPDFSTLDGIYPSWDGGDPGGARRVWQQRDYLYCRIKYRVDSVFLTSDYTATVRGKKTVESAKRTPLMWWFHRTKSTQKKVHYVALIFRNSSGSWLIRSETDL